jgi:2-amino-4-hydroxy-6-hydroxymethyldihydropteridine diphosphokinase
MGLPVFVALGSNLGDSQRLIVQAFDALEAYSATPLRRSSLWRSDPVGCPPGSSPFINAAAALTARPGETPETLLGSLQELERQFGRRPKMVLNEPRRLDLDLIGFGTLTRSSPDLCLPHPRAHLRRFVLEPLAELAPDLVLPGQSETVLQLLDKVRADQSVVRL